MTEKFCKPAEATDFADIKENLRIIRENAAEAMDKAGRTDTLKIMAVTKTVPVEKINYAESLGLNLLGENRVQEFLDKREHYSENSEVHFIGSLQTNKVKYIIDKVTLIHSCDSIKLANEISRRAVACGTVMDILFEVNIGGELSKGGIAPDTLYDIAKQTAELPGVNIRGLMCIPPPGSGEIYFAKMQELYCEAKAKSRELSGIDTLSMGMSGDYEQAIKYGSNIVRIGSGLFGLRNYNLINQ